MAVTRSAELVRPAKQARSRATRDRLLAAGRELLEGGAFDAIHVADIARNAGCSVGAFYQRFPDKDAFLTVLIETAVAEIVADANRFAADERRSGTPFEETLTNCMRHWAKVFKTHQGLYRTILKRSLDNDDSWAPLRELGPLSLKNIIEMIAEKCEQMGSSSFYYRVAAGFQIVFGAMINATMHRTVLLNLESEELIVWTSETLRHCIVDELPLEIFEHRADRMRF